MRAQDIPLREVYRYLGLGRTAPDAQTELLVQQTLAQYLPAVAEKSLLRRFFCRTEGADTVLSDADGIDRLRLPSAALAGNLRTCRQAVLLAATLGHGTETLMRRLGVAGVAQAAAAQAIGAATIEAYCDALEEQVRQQAAHEGLFLRPRFSPGYGDLPLAVQKDIFALLECEKRLGLTLTDTLLMLPSKSVTAIIGLTNEKNHCPPGKCARCGNLECEYRNECT